jgi:hypothetical protein
MNLAGFCRNCLPNWYRDAAAERGVTISTEAARERAIRGMEGEMPDRGQGGLRRTPPALEIRPVNVLIAVAPQFIADSPFECAE